MVFTKAVFCRSCFQVPMTIFSIGPKARAAICKWAAKYKNRWEANERLDRDDGECLTLPPNFK